jgi:zinc protease
VSARTADAAGVERRMLASGMPFLGSTDVDNELVAVRIQLAMGSRYESDAESGWAHLASRLLLKGTDRRSAARLAEDFESVGGRIATTTSKESTGIALLCARDVLAPCLDLLVELITMPSFAEAELETERLASLARIKAREDQLLGLAFDLFHELFYGRHPYHKPALGHEATVRACRRADARAVYERALRPGSTVVAAVGQVEMDPIATRLGSALAIAGPWASIPESELPADPARGEEIRVTREVETAKIVAGWPAPPLGHPDSPAMAVFAAVLGGSMDSRLFTELRDRRSLAYEVGSLYAGYVGPAFMSAYLGTRGEKTEVARAGLLAEVDRLRESGPSPEEVLRARSYLAGTRLMARERNMNRASLYATNELLGLGHDYEDRFLALLAAVTPATVRDVAQRWLDRPSVALVLPAASRGPT